MFQNIWICFSPRNYACLCMAMQSWVLQIAYKLKLYGKQLPQIGQRQLLDEKLIPQIEASSFSEMSLQR